MSLAVGSGIAKGADAFVQNFMQARRMAHEEKLQKNMNIVNIIMGQLHDENIPYDERAKILDTIPQLLGVDKDMERPLSSMMGLDKFNAKTIDDPNKPAAIPNSLQEDPNANGSPKIIGDPNATDGSISTTSQAATSYNVKGTQAQQIRQGSLSPAQIKLGLQRAQNKAIDDNDVDKQTKILTLNYTLQKNILNKGGYNKEVFRGYRTKTDGTKDYVVTLTNGEDERTINLGNVTPDAIEKANITAKGGGLKGKLGQLTSAQTTVQEYETDPNSHTKAEYDAAKSLVDDFEKTGKLKDATTVSLGQKIGGTAPPTPEQTRDNIAQRQKQVTDLQINRDNIKAQSITASAEAKQMADQLHSMWENEVAPLQKQIDAKKAAGEDDPSSYPEYKDLKQEYDKKVREYNALKIKADAAVSKDKGLQSHLADMEGRLKDFSTNAPSVTPRRILNPQQQDTIKKIRAKNPAQTKNMSDDDIINLVAKPK